jgi:beta-lactamase regulating signal transducer with metallopeptidase domain
MNDFCFSLLTNLLRTTAFLSVTAIVVFVVLKLSRCQSSRVHRVAWCLVILQGLLFVRVPWSIHWARQPTPLAVQAEVLPSNDEPKSLPGDTGIEFAPAMPEATIAFTPQIAQPPMQLGIAEIVSRHWVEWAALAWFGGIVMLVGTWICRYIRFLRTLPLGEPVPEMWQKEFIAALGMNGRQPPLELRITDDAGPLLCRRFGGYVLLVPKSLWPSLGAQERQAILRHEIGHYRRGDLWKSIAIRLLALPHWFNPFAWIAVRRFDEAAEWACDELAAAKEVSATAFANTLLKICESTRSYGVIVPAARGSSVRRRIGRLISLPSKGDSIMRKSIVFGLSTILLAAGALEMRLVADEPPLPQAMPPVILPADPDAPAPNYAQEMIKDAETTFQATQAAYDAGTVPMEPLYTWSRKWLQAILDVPAMRDQRLAAYQAHRDRMKQLYDEVHAKFLVGAKGGEADRNFAVKFYLAEANLWLSQQSGKAGAAAGVTDKNVGTRIEVYPISVADLDTVVKVVQTMLAGRPDVGLTIDAKTNSLVVQARPEEHAKIRELLGKLDVKPREFVVKPVAAADGVNTAAPAVEIVKRPAAGLPASTQVTYEVKSPAELIKILQPLLAGQPHVEMKSFASNSQLIVSAPAEQQEAIRALVSRVDRAGTAVADGAAKPSEPQKRIVAKFTNVDPAAAQKMLPQLAPEGSNYQVIYDFQDKSLVVKAPPEQNAPTNTEAPAATGQTAEKK